MTPINVIIDAIWRGAQDVERAQKDLAGIDGAANKGAVGLKKYAGAVAVASTAIAAIAVEARIAYTELERGTGLQLTAQRFDRLADSIGTTGDQLRNNLSDATAGLLTNAQQMALATDLVALGLARNESQVVRLSRVVTELDADIGELTLALANQTTRRFDQLGISVIGFEERLKSLEEQGLDTEAAFTEAFLQQAEAQIERVGGKADSAAGDLDRMEAAVGNLRDTAALALVDIVAFVGGFEGLADAADSINELSEALDGLRDDIDKFAALNKILSRDPQRQAEGIRELIASFEADKIQAAADEVESFDRAILNLNNTLENTVKLEEALRNLDEGFRTPESPTNAAAAASTIGQQFREIQEQQQSGRIELFEDFQAGINDINEKGEQERREITERYEEERTQIVENYNRQRAQEEEDYQRRLQRIQEDYQRSIEDLRTGAADDEQEARATANERLEDLERDHIRRLQDIIDSANLQLAEAASRLDASAVARIQRQRDDALRRENQNFSDQQSDVKRQLDEQLREISDNLDQRLEELREFHELRLERDEEDRQIRLDRLEEAHQDELRELDEQYRQRQQDLKDSIKAERAELTRRYTEAYNELTRHWSERQTLEERYQADILAQEEAWWNQRLALVGGGAGSLPSGGGAGDSNAGTPGGGGLPPNRSELLAMVSNLAMEQNYPDNIIQGLLRSMQSWTDEQIAKWIERTFGIDVPGYQLGTPFVPQTGLAMLHQGERVLTAAENRVFSSGNMGNFTFNIQTQPGMDEAKVARMARREFEDFLREMA